MSVHLTEEEQLEVLKRWWKDYGKAVIGAVLVAVIAYFGYTTWVERQNATAEQASTIYDQLVKSLEVEPGQSLSDTNKANAARLAHELKTEYAGGFYAQSASLLLAKLAVDNGDLDGAATELKALLDSKPEASLEQLAKLRLARVYIAKQSYSDALALLSIDPEAAFVADYAEAKGDALRGQGDINGARTAYQNAVSAVDPEQQERQNFLQMKLDDLASESNVATSSEKN